MGRNPIEREIYVYMELICFAAQQNLIQHCKATILQYNIFLKRRHLCLCCAVPKEMPGGVWAETQGTAVQPPWPLQSGVCCAVLVTQLWPTLWDPVNCSPLGSSVHGLLQAGILEWVAMPSSRGSSQPRNHTRLSCIAGGFFTSWATQEAPCQVWENTWCI